MLDIIAYWVLSYPFKLSDLNNKILDYIGI